MGDPGENFDELIGYTYLGDIFLRNPKTGQFAILFAINPELVPVEALAELAEQMKIAWQRKRKGGSGRPFLA